LPVEVTLQRVVEWSVEIVGNPDHPFPTTRCAIRLLCRHRPEAREGAAVLGDDNFLPGGGAVD
jgi:hypothetical protein